MRDGAVERTSSCDIFEPPRFFEAFLRGRAFTEAPDITARICGICPVAYQMSAVHAMEDALGVDRRRAAARAAPAALLRRVDREPRAAHLHAARAGLPGLRERHRHGARPRRGRAARAASSRRPATRSCAARRARDPSDQCARRRLLSRAVPARACAARRKAEMGARRGARDGALGRRLRLPRLRARLRVRRAAPPRRVSLQRGPHRLQPRARHHGARLRARISRKAMSSARRRCIRICAAAAPIWSGRSRATA